MDKRVRYSVEGGVATLELHNPPANTYSYEMMQQLDAAILAARFDATVHVLVLRGSGQRFFCAGADINMLQRVDPDYKYNFCLHANETLCRLEQTPKLVIAALGGHTVGGGLEVALAADLRLARRGGGKIGLPEIHLGVLPGTGGTQRLTRLVGKARAFEWIASGVNHEFERALEHGVISEILDDDDFDAAVMEYARRFVPPAKASHAVGLVKRAIQSGGEMSLHDGLALERELQQRLFASKDAGEGIAAYVGKRKPEFRGA